MIARLTGSVMFGSKRVKLLRKTVWRIIRVLRETMRVAKKACNTVYC